MKRANHAIRRAGRMGPDRHTKAGSGGTAQVHAMTPQAGGSASRTGRELTWGTEGSEPGTHSTRRVLSRYR